MSFFKVLGEMQKLQLQADIKRLFSLELLLVLGYVWQGSD